MKCDNKDSEVYIELDSRKYYAY